MLAHLKRFTPLALLLIASPARAYIEAPMSLGEVINQSNVITVMRVSKVDKEKKLVVYEKVEDLRGKFPTTAARHVITGQLKEGEIKTVLDLAEPGKTAVFFAKDGACEMCLDFYWYQIYKQGDDLYTMSHGEPFLLRSYAGKADRLGPIVRAILDGKEVAVPCMEDSKELLHKRAARIQRLKASLKLITYDPKRDFAGWGGEDIRRVPGGTGFSHIGPLSRVDAEARAAAAVDFDGDGRLDVCLAATRSVRLFQNQGDAYSEVALPGLNGGGRSAVWGDYNRDGKPDLLLATADGAKLFTNLGAGAFRADTTLLPVSPAGVTAAAWLDADGDGRPDVLLATAFNGPRLYLNKQSFADASNAWGLAAIGDARGETLAVADFDGDGRTDVLLGAGSGKLLMNTGSRFEPRPDAGLAFDPRVAPTVADYDGDGLPDVFVPLAGKANLFKNDGKGRFADVIDRCGDLAKPMAGATSAAWGDFDNDGHPDLFVGCLRGSNRYYRNNGDGTFTDQTAAVGLTGKVSNTQAVAVADLNGDGKLDLILGNEGQDSVLLFGNKDLPNKATPLVVHVPGGSGAVRVTGNGVQLARAPSGGAGRGQPDLAPRFVLRPGTYQVEVKDSAGKTQKKEVTLAADPMRVRFDEAVAPPKK